MSNRPQTSWPLLAAVALAVLLVQEGFAPTASASCGDYVTIVPHEGQHEARPEPVSEPVAPFCPCPAEPLRSPCEGPWCSSHQAPLPTPTSTLERLQDHWVHWWTAFLQADRHSSALRLRLASLVPIQRAEAIFHPPRAL